MIELGIVDLSASARRHLASLVERWAWVSPESRVSTPRVSLHLLSPEEVRFHGALDVCVVGPELIACDAAYITTLRQELSDKLILCVVDSRTYSFGTIEQLGRLGVDDVLVDTATSDEFFRRLVLLQRRMRHKKRGRLIVVDSARGGVGVTFVAAGLAEGWVSKKERVCIVDCDVMSHDLTRFLRVKPHVNEPLRILIEQQRVVTSETVAECAREVWADESRLMCVPPPAGSDDSVLVSPQASRAFIAVLETLTTLHDKVIVDASSLLAAARHSLYQAANEVVFVINRDPAGAFASRQALSVVAGYLRPESQLKVVLNDSGGVSASSTLFKREVISVVGRSFECYSVPHSARAARWPCSGHTPYRFLRRHLSSMLVDPELSGSAQHTAQDGALERGWVMCRELGRTFVKSLWRGRKGEAALTSGRQVGASTRSYNSLTLGFTENLLEQGELVSKPVLLG